MNIKKCNKCGITPILYKGYDVVRYECPRCFKKTHDIHIVNYNYLSLAEKRWNEIN